MVDGEEDALPRAEPPRPAEEGTGQGSQPGQTVRLRAGIDTGRTSGTGGGASKADAGRPAQRSSPTQQPPRRLDPAVALPHSSGAGKGRQGQVQVSQAKEEKEEEAEMPTGREAGSAVSSGDGGERRGDAAG